MEHHHLSPWGLFAFLGTILVNVLTWGGTYLTMGNIQQAGTLLLTILMGVFYVYSIIEKRKSIKKMANRKKTAA